MWMRTRAAAHELGPGPRAALRGRPSADCPSPLVSGSPRPSPRLALTAADRTPPPSRERSSRAPAHWSTELVGEGEAAAGSVTSCSLLAVPIRGHVGLPGVSDRALDAALSATFWSSASCHCPQPPTSVLPLPVVVSLRPGRRARSSDRGPEPEPEPGLAIPRATTSSGSGESHDRRRPGLGAPGRQCRRPRLALPEDTVS